MQSAIKLAAYGLIVASFSNVGALGAGHDEEGLVDYVHPRISTVSDLTNTADFSTVSTFAAFPPKEVTSLSSETFMRRMESVSGLATTTRTSTVMATATVTAEPDAGESGSMTTDAAPAKDTMTSVLPVDASAPGAVISIVTYSYQFTSTWASVVTHTILATPGVPGYATTADSTPAVATSTSEFDGISGTATGTGASYPGVSSGFATGTAASYPGVSSGYATGTDGTTLYPSTINGTWTSPVATPTHSQVSGAMGVKMTGAHIIGAAAVAIAVYLF